MPPPPGTPTEPRGMRGAQHSLPPSGPSLHATSPIKRDRNSSFGRRKDHHSAAAPDGDVMVNSSEQHMSLSPLPTTTAAAAEPPVPRLRSLAPAIFVPVGRILPDEETMVKTTALAQTDRVVYMRKALERCDRHTAAVRGNLLALFRRENARLMQVAYAEDAAAGYSPDDSRYEQQRHGGAGWWPASQADMERMLASMAAPAPSPPPKQPPAKQSSVVAHILQGKRGNAGVTPADTIGDVPEPSFTHRPVQTPRALAAREALMLVGKATTELRGYDAHISARRDMRRRALDKEIAQQRRTPPPVPPVAVLGIAAREAE